MPRIPLKDCNCDDWPCCEHADNFALTGQDAIDAMYCDLCGLCHTGQCPEDEDADDLECPESDDDFLRINLPPIDDGLDAAFEDRISGTGDHDYDC